MATSGFRLILVLAAWLLPIVACSSGEQSAVTLATDVGAFVSPSKLRSLPGQINVRLEPAHNKEYVWFHVAIGDSTVLGDIKGTLQIGGVPGEPATSDIWSEVEIWENNGYVLGMQHGLIDSAFFFLEVGGVRAALRLWDYFVDGCSSILVGALHHNEACPNDSWWTAEVEVEHLVKGSVEEYYGVPVYTERFPNGLQGAWLLHRDNSDRCSVSTNYRVIMYVPSSDSEEFLDRIRDTMEAN